MADHLENVPLHITGVDTDEEAMHIRRERNGDLDVEIVGDLRTVELPSSPTTSCTAATCSSTWTAPSS